MSTATLDRPLMLPPANVRPCEVRPPQWWDVGHERNRDAIALCNTACRFKDGCSLARGKPEGQIVAGIPYGDRSRPLPCCDTCRNPITNGSRRGIGGVLRCDPCRDAVIGKHRDVIWSMRHRGNSYERISRATGISAMSIRHYCNRHNLNGATA